MIVFWTFMLICNLLIPLTMFGFGKYFLKKSPKQINYIFGYRTTRSMKNKDTWQFAHHYCGKIWHTIGLILIPLTILIMIFVYGKDYDTVGTFSGIICGVQLIVLIGSIFPTEYALKQTFYENGQRKK